MCLTETQKKVDDIKIVKDVKIIQTMREMQDRKGGGLLIMYKEKEKYDLQKMTTRSTEILHVEGEIGKEQIRIVLVYMKTGNDNETKEHNKKIIEEIGQIVEEKEIQQKATIVATRRLQWTPGVPRKPRREHEWQTNKQNDTTRRSDPIEY